MMTSEQSCLDGEQRGPSLFEQAFDKNLSGVSDKSMKFHAQLTMCREQCKVEPKTTVHRQRIPNGLAASGGDAPHMPSAKKKFMQPKHCRH